MWPVRRASRSPRRSELSARPAQSSPRSARSPRAPRASLPAAQEFEREYPGARRVAGLALRELWAIGQEVDRVVSERCRAYDLSHAALNALAVIESNAGPLPSGEIAQRMHVTTGTITSLVDNLERRGLVVRLPDPEDRRRVMVDITPAAQQILDRLLPDILQVAKVVFDACSDRKVEALLSTIDDVRAGLADVPSELPPAKRNRPEHLDR